MVTPLQVEHPLRTKIFTVSMLPVLALVLVAVTNYNHLNALGESAEQIMDRNYRSIKAAQEARQVLESNRSTVLMALFDEENSDSPAIDSKELETTLHTCSQHIAEEGESMLVAELTRKFTRYAEIISHGDLNQIIAQATEFAEITDNMINGLNALIDLNEEGMEEAEQRTRTLARQAQRMSLVILCTTISLIIFMSYLLSTIIARPLRRLTEQLIESQQGRERYPTLPVTSADEIGVLTEEFNRLFASLARYDRHNADILAQEKAKVRQIEEARTRFIADLSHQLKTPMTSLAMSVNLLHDRRNLLSDEQVDVLLGTASEDCERIAKLLNELLDIARLEAMLRPVVHQPVDLAELVSASLKTVSKQARDKGVELITRVEAELPPVLLDPTRFPWVLTNLVGNALRYTEPGGTITLEAVLAENRLQFWCRDTGCGIEKQHLPNIFERYTQFAEQNKRGTFGLGLAIVKEIIEQHGGTIRVESQSGRGTTFYFWIPQLKSTTYAESTVDRR